MKRTIHCHLRALVAAAWVAACASSVSTDAPRRGPDRGPAAGSQAPGINAGTGSPGTVSSTGAIGGTNDTGAGRLQLQPKNSTLRIQHGDPQQSLQFEVIDGLGERVAAAFQLADASLGDIDDDGLFTPNGTRAGVTQVTARSGRMTLTTDLTVELQWVQNGATPDSKAGTPSGGYAGVGGEGPGGPLEAASRAALDGTPKPDSDLALIYPYDQTVFPLGLLAPLLMWSAGTGDSFDGVRVHLSGAHFDYRGDFGRPPALTGRFVRHPIPQEVWEAATHSVAGGPLEVELTFTRGKQAFGPITQTWTIARALLEGTVYYQSYGTHLAKNATGAVGGDGRFGGATLALPLGATSPSLVAGSDGGDAECRVCHSVSSDGSRMTVQRGDGGSVGTSSIDLLANNTETAYPDATNSQLAWIGLTPDGTLGLGNGEPLGIVDAPNSRLYDMTTGDPVPSKGLTEFVSEAAFPAFSQDGRKVAFNFFSGPGNAAIGSGDGAKLVAMDFDPSTRVFDNPVLLYGETRPAGWPGFTPTGTGVVYQVELTRGPEESFFFTRNGSTGELWWTNLRTDEAHPLELANGSEGGKSYLPRGPNQHDADHHLNYEPSVAPITAGGYAWIVFTSRRLYGNVATVDPWHSDPRAQDLSATPTTKKLWIAAIDLDIDTPEQPRPVGPDPSHPAFYLPGQELLAGNARGFWVLDPCKDDGNTCETGVDCCSGVCQKDPDSAELTCGPKTDACVELLGRCDTAVDCCDPQLACINNVCSQILQ
jgi:hypothetical protein